MKRLKVSQNFYLDEFVCPELYNKFGFNSQWFIRKELIAICQYIRTHINKPLVINNWFNGGNYAYSGLRPLSGGVGAFNSLHRYGAAVDIKVQGRTSAQVYLFIKEHWEALNKIGLTTLENIKHTPTWVHLDCRNTTSKELVIVNP